MLKQDQMQPIPYICTPTHSRFPYPKLQLSVSVTFPHLISHICILSVAFTLFTHVAFSYSNQYILYSYLLCIMKKKSVNNVRPPHLECSAAPVSCQCSAPPPQLRLTRSAGPHLKMLTEVLRKCGKGRTMLFPWQQ